MSPMEMVPSVDPSTGTKDTPMATPSVIVMESKNREWEPPRTAVGELTRNIPPRAK
jgi:hypothetical protein